MQSIGWRLQGRLVRDLQPCRVLSELTYLHLQKGCSDDYACDEHAVICMQFQCTHHHGKIAARSTSYMLLSVSQQRLLMFCSGYDKKHGEQDLLRLRLGVILESKLQISFMTRCLVDRFYPKGYMHDLRIVVGPARGCRWHVHRTLAHRR